ncbi:unnamed protein product [Knipowitschia caucasica]|uniref:C-type lectin domain-containing protein n=1 Tax=Knipowitschia caucasica TaxID=637954 RepID=A0AAV2JFR6_KNICA
MDSESDQSFEQRISEDSNIRRQYQRPKIKKGVVFGFRQYRVVVVCLGLLDTGLLIAALVLGIYCARAKDMQQVSDSAFAPLVIERDFLRNQSDLTKASATVQKLESRRKDQTILKLKVKQLQVVGDHLQSHILLLRVTQTDLEANKTQLERSCGRCPPGWLLLKTSCYFFHIPLSNFRKNWPDSRADCVSRGADLLVINNLDEQKLINSHYPKLLFQHQWTSSFWIGLTDAVSSGVWTWVNNVTEDNTMYWFPGQPTTGEKLNKHCAVFGRSIVSWKSWFNRDCEHDRLNWICEMPPR